MRDICNWAMSRFDRLPGIDESNTTRRNVVVGGVYALAGCVALGAIGGGSDDEDDTSASENGDGSDSGEPEPEPEPESESELRGPTREDRTYVDLQYREYTEEERSTVRNNAESIGYDELYRNVESYAGEAVTYDGSVIQNLESENHFTFLIALNNDTNQPVYGSWTGDRFIEGDTARIWAEVLGIEIYQTGSGAERSVPALSIADMELLEEGGS